MRSSLAINNRALAYIYYMDFKRFLIATRGAGLIYNGSFCRALIHKEINLVLSRVNYSDVINKSLTRVRAHCAKRMLPGIVSEPNGSRTWLS